MRRIILAATLLLSCFTASGQGKTEINKELPRSSFVSFRSKEQALEGDKSKSENFADLTGEWSFVKRVDTTKFTTLDRKIMVPFAAQLNGMGEAIYSEKAYPFLKAKPTKGSFVTPDSDSMTIGRDFSVPFDYTDRALFLHIGAANAAVTVYINGKEVGYSTDSRNPAEFDISKFVVRGKNQIVLKIDRHCDGSYLEDQSEWRLSGLNRDIYMFAQPKIRARDFLVRTTLDPTYKNGLLETALLLKTQLLNTHKVKIYYDLFDPQGNLVNQANKEIEVGMRSEDTVRFTATILDVKQWNSETPNLYTVLYRIQREGRFTEYVALKAGFRTVEIKEGEMLINGKAIKIKGVNYAEFSPVSGNVLSGAEMEQAIRQMKLAGLNAIRTDGYPLPNEFYDLCDRMGIYVADVANINAQGVGTSTYKGETIANDPAWVGDFLYRVNNTFERNKSHTSVIMWALGDNAGNGYNMYEAYMMLKRKEPTRPITYNGAGLDFNSEIFCPDFMTALQLEEIASAMDGQPIIFSRCPFDAEIWQSEAVQGGFIDRWSTPTITAKGKFAELGNDYKLTPKSDGTITLPSADQQIDKIRESFQGVVVHQINAQTFAFENRLDFSNLSELKVMVQTYKKGKLILQGELRVDALPGTTKEITLPKKLQKSHDKTVITIENIATYTFE